MPEPDLSMAVATCNSPAGAAYRGKPGCKSPLCTQDGNPDRCYGWHCLYCDGTSNCQGNCVRCEGNHGLDLARDL